MVFKHKETHHNINSLLFGCILLLCSLNDAYSQNVIDSLLRIVQSAKDDTGKVIHLNELCMEYQNIGEYNTAIKYGKTSLKLARKIMFVKGIASSYNSIGSVYEYIGNYDKALENYFASLKIWQETGNKEGLAASYNIIGLIYADKGNYNKALENHLASLKIKEELGDKEGLAASYNNIGNIYYYQEYYDKALENHLASLKIDEEINNKEGIAASYNNIGNIYKEQGNHDKALENYFASQKISEETGNKQGIAMSYINIGNIYEKQGNYDKALESYFASQKISEEKEIGNKLYLAASYNNIGIIYTKKGNYPKAIAYLQKGLVLSTEIDAKDLMMEIYQELSNVNEKMNDYKNAYKYHQRYSQIKDSIFNKESNKQITEMEAKYETEKKKKAMLVQQIQINQKNYIIFGLLIFVLFIVVMAFVIVRQNKLLANQKVLELEGRLLRLQLNPHFIFNALSAIKAVIPHKPPEVSSEFLTKFSQLMRSILETSKEEYISLEEDIKIITHYLELQKLRFDNKFEYRITISREIEPELVMVPPMLAKQFIENAVEHGIKNMPAGGLITVRLLMNETTLHLEIEDNGIGLSKTRDQTGKDHKPMAVDITKERLKNLNRSRRQKINMTITGLIENDSSQPSPISRSGTKVVFAIPLT